jgi:hypothetical protein
MHRNSADVVHGVTAEWQHQVQEAHEPVDVHAEASRHSVLNGRDSNDRLFCMFIPRTNPPKLLASAMMLQLP